MREILLNDEMHIYVPEGDGPAIDIEAAMFGPYTKPKMRIDYIFPMFVIGALMALSDNILVSGTGCAIASFIAGSVIASKVSK